MCGGAGASWRTLDVPGDPFGQDACTAPLHHVMNLIDRSCSVPVTISFNAFPSGTSIPGELRSLVATLFDRTPRRTATLDCHWTPEKCMSLAEETPSDMSLPMTSPVCGDAWPLKAQPALADFVERQGLDDKRLGSCTEPGSRSFCPTAIVLSD